MALRSDWSDEACPIARGIDVIGDPWTLVILREALAGARRFDEFKRRVGASDKTLAARLSKMVEDGLLEARPYSAGAQPRREYAPTEKAADAVPVLQAYAAWAHKHRPSENEEPRFAVVCGTCSASTERVEICDACGAALDVSHGVTWQRPGGWDGSRVVLTGEGS